MLQLSRLWRRFQLSPSPTPPPRTLDLPGTVLRLRELSSGGLQVLCPGREEPLFSMPGTLQGSPTRTSGQDAAQVRLRLQVRSPEGRLARLLVSSDSTLPPEGPWQILRTSEAVEPGGARLLEVVLGGGVRREIRYLFEGDAGLEVRDFPQVEDSRPLFSTVPPVAQMGALLRVALAEPAPPGPADDFVLALARRCHSRRMLDLESWVEGQVWTDSASHRALHGWLEACGAAPPAGILGPATLFVDVEAGLLSEEDHVRCLACREAPPPSAYAVWAVATALEPRARLFEASGAEGVARLADGPILSCQDGMWRPGWQGGAEFALLRLPLLEQLGQPDLDVLLALGRPLLGHFTSDLEHRVLWRRLTTPGDPTFLEGISMCRFSGRVVGHLEPLSPHSDARVAAYRDNRGNLHYRAFEAGATAADIEAEAKGDLEWTGLEVVLPSLAGVPDRFGEPDRNRLLGRKPALKEEWRALEHLRAALALLRNRPSSYRLATPEEEAALVAEAAPFLGRPRAVEVLQALDGLDISVLRLLAAHHIRQSSGAGSASLRGLRAELEDRCLSLLQDEDRVCVGLVLAGQPALAQAKAVRWELERFLRDAEPSLAARAAAALVGAVLAEELPAPPPVRFAERAVSPAADPALQGLLLELEAWTHDLGRTDRATAESLPWRSADGRVLSEAAAPLLRLLVALNRAFEAEGPRERFLCLLDTGQLSRARPALLRSWQLFCAREGEPLPALLARRGPAGAYRDYLAFVHWWGAESLADQAAAPSLGGPLAPLAVFRLAREEKLAFRGESAPFAALVEALRVGRLETLRVCALSQAGGVTLSGSIPTSQATLEVEVDPGTLEVFHPSKGRFLPFLRDAAWLRELLRLGDQEWEAVEALLHLYYGVRAERDTEFNEARRRRSGISEERHAGLGRKSSQVACALGLGTEHHRRVLDLLLETEVTDDRR